jgi:uncharacterized protein YutE (UPF0331/DUF86 family)
MVDANLVAQKLKQLALRIAKVEAQCPPGAAELAEDSDLLDLVSFNLLLAVQACIDLATHLIADEAWEPAATAREALERLQARGVISRQSLEALRNAIGLRNIVAHGYSGVQPGFIHAAATGGLADLNRFASEVSAWVEGRIAPED